MRISTSKLTCHGNDLFRKGRHKEKRKSKQRELYLCPNWIEFLLVVNGVRASGDWSISDPLLVLSSIAEILIS
jgi:hypothetical protein